MSKQDRIKGAKEIMHSQKLLLVPKDSKVDEKRLASPQEKPGPRVRAIAALD